MEQTIRFRKKIINKVFPVKFEKMRMEDFTNKAIDNEKILNKREFDALVNFRVDLCSRGNTKAKEFFAKRHKDKIEFVGFDE
jgi:hypothetical protein